MNKPPNPDTPQTPQTDKTLEQNHWQETLQALDSVSQGRVISGEAVHAWLQSWGTDDEQPFHEWQMAEIRQAIKEADTNQFASDADVEAFFIKVFHGTLTP